MLMAGARNAADPAIARMHALSTIASQVRREAYVSAYADAFFMVAVGLIISLLAVLLLRKPPKMAGPGRGALSSALVARAKHERRHHDLGTSSPAASPRARSRSCRSAPVPSSTASTCRCALDQVQADWLAASLAARFDAIVWPTLTYGFYPAFVAYAGSASLSEATFEAVMRELATSLVGYGARVIVVDTGISTIAPVDRALARPPRAASPASTMASVLARPCARGRRSRTAATPTRSRPRSCSRWRPTPCRWHAPEASPASPPGPGPMQHADSAAANHSRAGAIGDPTLGDARKRGEAMLAAMLGDAVEAVSAWV